MLNNFRSLLTTFIGLLTLSVVIKHAHAQFKILDSSSFRGSSSNSGRHDDHTKIALVMINPIGQTTLDDSIITTEDTAIEEDTSSPSRPRGFMPSRAYSLDDDLPLTKLHTTDTTTENSAIQRVGKLQEKPQAINRKLLENDTAQHQPKSNSRSVDDRSVTPTNKYSSQIIRIQTINPLLRAYSQTLPTKKSFRRGTIEDENLIEQALAKQKRLKPQKYQFRKFKSKCHCEKLSNCQKLQVTIQRCPPNQFMCCFW